MDMIPPTVNRRRCERKIELVTPGHIRESHVYGAEKSLKPRWTCAHGASEEGEGGWDRVGGGQMIDQLGCHPGVVQVLPDDPRVLGVDS